MTADYTIEATPGQVAAIERDGFLVVAGPMTKPCPECGGRGTARYPIDNYAPVRCNECNGDGTVPIVVEVVVPERECPDHERSFLTNLCTTCGSDSEIGTIPARTLLRGTAEAVPVEKCSGYTLHICEEVGVWLLHSPLDKPFNDDGLTEYDITHHFADVPRPEVGDTGGLVVLGHDDALGSCLGDDRLLGFVSQIPGDGPVLVEHDHDGVVVEHGHRVAVGAAVPVGREGGLALRHHPSSRMVHASPRYAVAYWLAAMQSELLCAELAAADCMDDADDLIADLAAVGLTIVRKATP